MPEFIRANCEYPGRWDGEIQRKYYIDDLIITVTHVYTRDKRMAFHVTSFIQTKNGLITGIDEYWGDDGDAPQWRQDKHIGCEIERG